MNPLSTMSSNHYLHLEDVINRLEICRARFYIALYFLVKNKI
ncbi:hypothetical protein AO380_1347 [Moraxella catarrhalis]|nr:hypothetical protein AO380_1347 [Moraxella catarrhalis]